MPKELREEEIKDFVELSKAAEECRVKRIGDTVKLKLRTSRYLYTLKLKPDKAEEIVKNLGCPVIEG
ncbi:MAG: 50S ribosomal protein L38e [Promethearchaeati archaeon SRVP18_Atabeyarchaeia-1]